MQDIDLKSNDEEFLSNMYKTVKMSRLHVKLYTNTDPIA